MSDRAQHVVFCTAEPAMLRQWQVLDWYSEQLTGQQQQKMIVCQVNAASTLAFDQELGCSQFKQHSVFWRLDSSSDYHIGSEQPTASKLSRTKNSEHFNAPYH